MNLFEIEKDHKKRIINLTKKGELSNGTKCNISSKF